MSNDKNRKCTSGHAKPTPPVVPVHLSIFKASFTAFVGGAADKYQFLNRPLGIEPPDDIGAGPTYIMSECLRKFKKNISNNNLNHAEFQYYGYEEAYSSKSVGKKYRNTNLKNLFADIKDRLEKEPKTQINLVGHSLGGWNVAGLSEELYKNKVSKIHTLITLDPVGIRLSKTGGYYDRAQIYFLEPDPVSDIWVNIYSQPKDNERDDYIAILGGRWNDDDTSKANFKFISSFHHGQAEDMFNERRINNKYSAADILLKELMKVVK